MNNEKNIKTTTEIGNIFEQHAVDHLLKYNAQIIARQYKSPYGEIDIIAKITNKIIFVEVKARKSLKYGGAIYSISKAKQAKIINTAEFFMQDYHIHSNQNNIIEYRFDAIIFDSGKIEWIQNCIYID
jgi:putative endonuclease